MTKAEKIASFCEKYNVNEADFMPKDKSVSNEERMDILEDAILELGTLIAEVERNG